MVCIKMKKIDGLGFTCLFQFLKGEFTKSKYVVGLVMLVFVLWTPCVQAATTHWNGTVDSNWNMPI